MAILDTQRDMVMRQVDGKELLKEKDPRSASIGIIYVSPNDDRQSVLTAILIQDKLGRDQIVIVLPDQNRAFQRPIDFDGLKSIRRGLQAQIIFVASSGPGPAEFARQRRFPVYSSLENYIETLQGENSTQEDTKKGWMFWRREKSQETNPDTPAPLPAPTTEEEQTQPLSESQVPPSEQISTETESEDGDQYKPSNAVAEEEEQALPPTIQEDDLVPVQEDEESQVDASSEVDSDLDASPDLEIDPDSGIDPSPDVEIDPDSDIDTLQQPSSETRSNLPAPIVSPSIVTAYPVRRSPFRYSRSTSKPVWLIAAALLFLLLIGGYIVARIFFGPPLSATVTITPGSKDLKNTYAVSAVIGTPDPSQRQVQARLLFSTLPAQSITVNATGIGSIPATQATGFLIFYNSSTYLQSVPVDTVFVGTDGVAVVNDQRADIPAARPPLEGFVAVTAHAIKPGTAGNISAFDINGPCCMSGITVRNTVAFHGGQDAQSYTYLQQGDIDGAANTLEKSLKQDAQASLQRQMYTSERLAGSPECLSNVTSNFAASYRVTNVTVSVTEACLGEVYDYRGALVIAEDLLKGKASTSLGAGYSLVGNLVTTLMQATVEKNEMVSLLFKVEGVWAYQFSDAQKKNLAKLIAGKKLKDARALLEHQTGVSKANIQLSQSGGETLPTNPAQITIVTQGVPGVQGTPTPIPSLITRVGGS